MIRYVYEWEGVPQGPILERLSFLIYINDWSTKLKSNVKLFANDTSLYLIVFDPLEAAGILSKGFEKV